VAAGPPSVSGGSTVGSNLSCSKGSWADNLLGSFLFRAPRSFAYSWSKDGATIPAAAGASIAAGSAGNYACRVTAENAAGSTSQTSAALVVTATAAPEAECVVPKLLRKRLKGARKALRRARCHLGRVTPRGRKSGKVKKQHPKPGRVLPVGGRVNIKLG
jgi:hypothetical protein